MRTHHRRHLPAALLQADMETLHKVLHSRHVTYQV